MTAVNEVKKWVEDGGLEVDGKLEKFIEYLVKTHGPREATHALFSVLDSAVLEDTLENFEEAQKVFTEVEEERAKFDQEVNEKLDKKYCPSCKSEKIIEANDQIACLNCGHRGEVASKRTEIKKDVDALLSGDKTVEDIMGESSSDKIELPDNWFDPKNQKDVVALVSEFGADAVINAINSAATDSIDQKVIDDLITACKEADTSSN